MTVGSPPDLQREHGAVVRNARSAVLLRTLSGAAVALATPGFAALLAVWPTLTLLVVGLVLVAVLAWFAPPFALVAVVLLYGLEGVIKVGLTPELDGVGVTPEAVGAAVIDVASLVAVVGLARQDRGRTLLAIWHNAGLLTRIALGMLAGWLALSLVQIPLSGDLGTALAGFRLTQGYVLFAGAGAVLLARSRPEHVVATLVGVLLIIAAYAALRAVIGPSDGERLAAFSRSTTPLVPSENSVIFRNVGSISSAIGLASFLVPAGVFLFALGLSLARMRLAAWIGVALIVFALVATHVRASLLALALGVICAAALFTFTSGLAKRAKVALAAASVPLLIFLIVFGALVPTALSGGSPEVQLRSSGVLHPFADPSVEQRLERWGDALDVIRANPIGTGLGTVGSATINEQGTGTFVDNSYLKIFQEQGPLGGIIFLGALLTTLTAAAVGVGQRDQPRRAIGVAALVGGISFLALAMSSEAIEQPGKVLGWLLLGVALWAAGMPSRGSTVEGAA